MSRLHWGWGDKQNVYAVVCSLYQQLNEIEGPRRWQSFLDALRRLYSAHALSSIAVVHFTKNPSKGAVFNPFQLMAR